MDLLAQKDAETVIGNTARSGTEPNQLAGKGTETAMTRIRIKKKRQLDSKTRMVTM